MKKIIVLIIVSTILFSCANKNDSVAQNKTQQNDTVKSGNANDIQKKDTIIQNGEYIKHYKNGVIEMRGMMNNGKRDGLWKSWYDNGLPWSETTFKDGKKNGSTKTWYENEKVRYTGFYTNDIESGKWNFWDDKGNLFNTKDYDAK